MELISKLKKLDEERKALLSDPKEVEPFIREETARFWDEAEGKAKPERSPRAEELCAAIDKLKGDVCEGGRKSIAKLVEVITGEKLDYQSRGSFDFTPNVVMFVKNEYDCHNYGIGPVFICGQRDYSHISEQRNGGNHLPNGLEHYRRPTDEEISRLLKSRYEEIISAIIKSVTT